MLIFSDAQMLKCSNAHLKTSRMLWDRHQPPVKLQGEKVIGCSFWSLHHHRYHPNRSCHNRHDHHHHQLPVEVCLGGGGHEVVAAPWLELHLLRWGGEAPETEVVKIYLLVVELFSSQAGGKGEKLLKQVLCIWLSDHQQEQYVHIYLQRCLFMPKNVNKDRCTQSEDILTSPAHGLLPKPKLTFEETSNVTLIIGFGRPPLLGQPLQRLPVLS